MRRIEQRSRAFEDRHVGTDLLIALQIADVERDVQRPAFGSEIGDIIGKNVDAADRLPPGIDVAVVDDRHDGGGVVGAPRHVEELRGPGDSGGDGIRARRPYDLVGVERIAERLRLKADRHYDAVGISRREIAQLERHSVEELRSHLDGRGPGARAFGRKRGIAALQQQSRVRGIASAAETSSRVEERRLHLILLKERGRAKRPAPVCLKRDLGGWRVDEADLRCRDGVDAG